MGSIYCEGDKNARRENYLKDVLNAPTSWQKGKRNKRFESIVEKKSDEIKRRAMMYVCLKVHMRYGF